MSAPSARADLASGARGARHWVRGNFVMLRADDLRLLLAQEEVGAAQYIHGLAQVTTDAGVFSLGDAADAEGSLQLVALSAQLQPLVQFPADRFLQTPLGAAAGGLCFAWNEVRVLIGIELQVTPMPDALRASGGPIEAYALVDGAVVLCTTAEQLVDFAFAQPIAQAHRQLQTV